MTADVSRETSDLVERYLVELVRWNPKINLVAKGDLSELATRHAADSLQLAKAAPGSGHWVDLGSGGGFPGILVAIHHRFAGGTITLVEADARKCAFLRQVVRMLELRVEVVTARIEDLTSQRADIISARALAGLDQLLAYAEPHLAQDGQMLFAKGESWSGEVDIARKTWHFDLEAIQSETRKGAAILKIKNARRR